MRAAAILAIACAALCPGCKVGLLDVNAAFTVADATWFQEEETLFIFYEMGAEQGLNPDTVIE
ncbi:MAG: hypothetical protein KC613_26220, partial [Myxococcales bacterium]|nr:hypothetical protein [Myxococcales bacterium]